MVTAVTLAGELGVLGMGPRWPGGVCSRQRPAMAARWWRHRAVARLRLRAREQRGGEFGHALAQPAVARIGVYPVVPQ